MPIVKFQSRDRAFGPRAQTPEGANIWGGFSRTQLGTSSVLSMAGSRLDLALLELTNMTYGSGFFASCEGKSSAIFLELMLSLSFEPAYIFNTGTKLAYQ